MQTYIRGVLAACVSLLVLAAAHPAHGDTTSTAPDVTVDTAVDTAAGTAPPATSTSTTVPVTTVPPTPEPPPAEPRYRPLPRLRCQPGINPCVMAIRHQRAGRYLWRDGERFIHHGRVIRGNPDITWARMRLEARRLRTYLRIVAYARAVEAHRRQLVAHWSGVANCESGGNWAINTGNGYYGGLQFNLGTWRAYGGRGLPNQQPAWYQAAVADRIRVTSGLHHWPHCGRYYR